jgi:hypothetical protein
MVDTTEAKQVTSAASSLLFPEIDLAVASNATYTREDFDPVLSRIAFDNEFANAGAKAYQCSRGDNVAVDTDACNPLARALLYNLRDLSADGIDDQFDAVREQILSHATRARAFEKPVDVAIDIHDWLFYGEEETPMVANTNPDQGTNLAYKFATICIVDPDVRFTLDYAVLEDGTTDELAAAVRQLVSTAREFVTLKHVYCDREFYRVRLVKIFDELGVDLVMRAPTNRGVQRRIEEHDTDTFITEYEMRRSNPPTCRVDVRLVVVPHRTREDDHFCLVTTRELDPDAVEFAEPLAQAYRRRWGIETSYRKVGEFLPKTTSPTFSVRLFYFLLAVALYNLWVLVNLLLRPQHTTETTQTIPTAIFREFLGKIPYG